MHLDYSARGGAIAVKVNRLGFRLRWALLPQCGPDIRVAPGSLDTDEFAAIMAHEVGHDYD